MVSFGDQAQGGHALNNHSPTKTSAQIRRDLVIEDLLAINRKAVEGEGAMMCQQTECVPQCS